jgi:predicted homoserine dehydrogenase-like protein
MNLFRLLSARAAEGRLVRVGLIGAGKFGTMFLAQVPSTPGLAVTAIADLQPGRGIGACLAAGWGQDQTIRITQVDDGAALARRPDVDVVVEATGNPAAGIRHARAAIAAGKHVVMVNVEADALAGPLLAAEAQAAGVVYSLAYGDQPALIAELVDWARASGFRVAAAGKGTKYLPAFHFVMPDEVWTHYGISPDEAKRAGMNPQMFNSFLDGTKSAIEMAAVANACDLEAPSGGLMFPPCGVDELAHILRPQVHGGVLEGAGMVEVVSSLERDGRPVPRDLRWGVYVIVEAANGYAASCFKQYGLKTDSTGCFAAMYRPFHLIGLELGISIASVALRGVPTGSPAAFKADAVAVAKRDLKSGDVLDGEGGYTVFAKCVPARRSVQERLLPIGLAHNVTLVNNVPRDTFLTYGDVAIDQASEAAGARRDMVKRFG